MTEKAQKYINVLVATESVDSTGSIVIEALEQAVVGTEFDGALNFAEVLLTDHEAALVTAALVDYITIIVLSRTVNAELTSIYLNLLGQNKPHIEFAIRKGDTDGDEIPVLWTKEQGIETKELQALFLRKLRELVKNNRLKI